ncbi:hypothetical protein ACJ41O_010076 [Fusarium nematophilum]
MNNAPPPVPPPIPAGATLSQRATNQDIEALLQGAALRPFEHFQGGRWTVTGRHKDTIIARYAHRGGEAEYLTSIHLCVNPENTEAVCRDFIYEYSEDEMMTVPVHNPQAVQSPAYAQAPPCPPLIYSQISVPPASNAQPPPGFVQVAGNPPAQGAPHVHGHAQVQAEMRPASMMPQLAPVQNIQVPNITENQPQYATGASVDWTGFGDPATTQVGMPAMETQGMHQGEAMPSTPWNGIPGGAMSTNQNMTNSEWEPSNFIP